MLNGLVFPFLLGSASLLALLSALVVEKKLTRTYSEWASRERRRRYRAAVRDGSLEELLFLAREVRRRRPAQEDLAVVLESEYASLGEDRRALFQEAASRTGLKSALTRRIGSRSAVKRGRAALLVARLRLPGAAEALEPLVFDPDPDVQHTAVHGMALLESPEAAWALLRALGTDALAPERIVERVGRRWAVPVLIEAIDREDMRPIRGRVAAALGLAGDHRAERALTDLLRYGNDEERVQACRALSRLALSSAVPALMTALGDPFWPVRAQAARGLERISDERALAVLEQGLSDESWWVRANCAQALRRIENGGLDVLWKALDHPDRFARERAFEALALESALVAQAA